jgi:hypothetical protein
MGPIGPHFSNNLSTFIFRVQHSKTPVTHQCENLKPCSSYPIVKLSLIVDAKSNGLERQIRQIWTNYKQRVNLIKTAIFKNSGYTDKGNRMANTYSISHRTWKCTKYLFIHLLDKRNFK